MKWIGIACLFIMAPFILFYAEKTMTGTNQFHVYWIWEKLKDVILATTLYMLSYRSFKVLPLVLIVWTSIRLLWHIATITLPAYKEMPALQALNQSQPIAILFLILVTLLTVLMIVLFVKKWPRRIK